MRARRRPGWGCSAAAARRRRASTRPANRSLPARPPLTRCSTWRASTPRCVPLHGGFQRLDAARRLGMPATGRRLLPPHGHACYCAAGGGREARRCALPLPVAAQRRRLRRRAQRGRTRDPADVRDDGATTMTTMGPQPPQLLGYLPIVWLGINVVLVVLVLLVVVMSCRAGTLSKQRALPTSSPCRRPLLRSPLFGLTSSSRGARSVSRGRAWLGGGSGGGDGGGGGTTTRALATACCPSTVALCGCVCSPLQLGVRPRVRALQRGSAGVAAGMQHHAGLDDRYRAGACVACQWGWMGA